MAELLFFILGEALVIKPRKLKQDQTDPSFSRMIGSSWWQEVDVEQNVFQFLLEPVDVRSRSRNRIGSLLVQETETLERE